jgi:HPt (histidine-containing phosphotransfer) domain-containing protein
MDGFLTKPLDIARLREFLIGFGLRRATDASPLDHEHSALPVPPSDPQRAGAIDLAKLEEVTGGDAEFTAELLETFFASAAESLDQMTQTLGSENRAELARIAHRLKGAALNIHATAVATLAARLEQEAKSMPFELLALLLDELRGLVAHVAQFMREACPDAMRAA